MQTTATVSQGTGCLNISAYQLQNSEIGVGNGTDNAVTIDFNASKSNPTYVTNGSLRPNSISILVLIKI